MNKNIVINNVPSSKRSQFGFNKINKSEDHNKFQEETLNDILDLFNKVNSIERRFNENLEYLKLENSYINSLNAELLNKIEALKERIEDLSRGDKTFIVNPIDCTSKDKDFNLGADIDLVSNSITAKPSKKISKLSIFDSITDSIYIPNSLSVNVVDTTEGGTISNFDKDLYSPFFNDDNLYYIRTSITDSSAAYVTYDYILTMPEEIMTTPNLNEIFIEPFLCKITGVYIRYGDSTTWELVEGFEYNSLNDETKFLNFSKAIKLNFQDKKANQIKISLRCDTFTERETNTRRFVSGIKQIGAYINYYNISAQNFFQFDMNLPERHNYIIKDITPYFNNSSKDSMYSKDFYYDIYFKDDLGYEHKIVDTFPFKPPTNNLVFKCRFGDVKHNANISKIEVKYSHE